MPSATRRWARNPLSLLTRWMILDNLRRLVAGMNAGEGPGALWIRTPLIPGATATPENDPDPIPAAAAIPNGRGVRRPGRLRAATMDP